jgi:FkbM family methyltransferase
MLKKYVKKSVALATEKIARWAVKKGCIKQDNLIYLLSNYEKIVTKFGELTLFCPGEIPTWRAKTFFTKEPETLQWIDSFGPEETMLDIGANIGQYSIYAALKNHKVMAIEPMSDNYFILQKNIEINKLENVTAFCLCMYDENKIDTLKIRNNGFGQAQNSFDENVGAFDESYEYEVQQGVVGITVDYLCQKTFIPNHIKIDVDGHELKVIYGASDTLRNKILKSVFIEMNEKSSKYQQICDFICSKGFIISEKLSSDMMKNSKFSMFKNYIFKRP